MKLTEKEKEGLWRAKKLGFKASDALLVPLCSDFWTKRPSRKLKYEKGRFLTIQKDENVKFIHVTEGSTKTRQNGGGARIQISEEKTFLSRFV